MCNCPPDSAESKASEREKLEASLRRVDALDKTWCDDGKRVIAAARKYLDLLPKPKRKVAVTRYLVVGAYCERGPYLEEVEAQRVAFCEREARVIPLHGEYEV